MLLSSAQSSVSPMQGAPRPVYLNGNVRLADGKVPAERVVDKSFPTSQQTGGLQAGLSDRDLVGCEIRASLPGYVSDTINLGFRRVLDNPFIGTIYLHPVATAETYFYSTVASYGQKNLKGAEENAREAAKRDPQHLNPKINLLLGVLLTEKKEFKEAAENLRVYLEANPSAPDAPAVRQQLATLENWGTFPANWIHGSDPCVAKVENAFQVHAYNENTYILREDKCINYEGPFVYLFFGEDKVFMQDTGAAPRADSGIAFPMRETVMKVIDEWSKKHGKTTMQLVVTHSHMHGDHTGGDSQFAGQPNTTMMKFGATDSTLDLGGRILDIMPIPGHEAASVAVYDRNTKLLLTGDTVYPGRLYIHDWPAFKASIEKLAIFVRTHEVSHVLGTHIEMSNKAGVDYPVRTTYQPEEHTLEMTPTNILELYQALLKMGDTPVRDVHKDFIVYPK
jgi:hypothetical protein